MKIDRISVRLEKRISKETAGQWNSYEISYGAEASLGAGETIEQCTPALDAKVRGLLSQAPGFKAKGKLLFWK